MGQVLTAADVMMCPHAGQVSISALQSTVAAVAPMLRPDDVFTVAACPFMVGPLPHPCMTVDWQSPSARVKAGDRGAAASVLTTDSLGMCKAADQAAQGMVMIQKTQMAVKAQ